MVTTLKCIECSLQSFLRLIDEHKLPEDLQEKLTKELLIFLANMDFSLSPPVIAKFYHEKIRKVLNNKDPYYEKKKLYNEKLLKEYDKFKEMINSEEDPVKNALKLAIAGNIIDFAPNHKLDMEKTIKEALAREMEIDCHKSLIENLKKSKSILYIMDNAGEIVFDRLFIETLIEKNIIKSSHITGATRGYPVINDVTPEDAKDTGLDKIIKIINTGDNTPGVILSTSSKEFLEHFEKADLIISKGQGNFESLQETEGKLIYFLLIAKCSLIAQNTGAHTGSFICLKKGA